MGWGEYSLVFVVSASATFLMSLVADRVGLVAVPGEHRTHTHTTPVVGGVGIFVGALLGWYISAIPLSGVGLCFILLFVVGVLDDRFALPSWLRLLAQGGAAYLMVELTGVRLISLGYIWSAENEMLLGDGASLVLTIFATIGVINAINMSDGMDGLAGSLVLLILGALFYLGAYPNELVVVSMFSVAGFLVWNLRLFRPRARIFMGDAGSTVLGLLLVYLLISNSQSPGGFPPVTALWLLTLPLIDAVAVLFLRPMRGQSPFTADNVHYHHLMSGRGLTVNAILALVLAIQLLAMLVGLIMWRTGLPESIQVLAFLLVFAFYFCLLAWLTRKK
ncbi:hypothetical protein [Arenicella xantha]|uniref:UDP-GlcNAc:undecaprenyl-phosphate GlcNAc-1-phosphate transferase n=1 Tax=Arenicella xantha TaxID=644221 RepID=A0A395JGR9_9GAMM|nr:hypothetical protein [Arenicella xantha]RBP49180.1 UDP-GlcNAc:undecaprenyl-phosphate GlcNAc-1-phosphate transferase [Arenicella xantha]